MKLSNKQKMLLHRVPAELGIDDAQRRVIQRNIGGFYSAAGNVTREGFIAVMAFYEGRSGGRLKGFAAGYWAGQDAEANPTDALIWRIKQQGNRLAMDTERIEAFMGSKHMSGGQYSTLSAAPAYWLRRLLQALIEMTKRKRRQTG